MSTVAYAPMKELARGIEKIYPSAVCSGIVGDKRHDGGYHIGRKFQSGDNYSVVRPDDRAGCGPPDGSSGVDITMNRRDMILATSRIAAAFKDQNDPRRKYLNAVNGWLGRGSATRYDFYARRAKSATPDHKSHLHAEKRRRYICDRVSNDAILSVLRGETVHAWLVSRGVEAPGADAVTSGRKATARAMKAPPYPGRILRRNDRAEKADPAVKAWQQRMRDRGWKSIGPADGKPGPKFEQVVKAWQRTVKLRSDGEVGPKTWPTPWTRALSGSK